MNNAEVKAHLDACLADLLHVSTAISSLGVTSSLVPYLTNYAVIRACGAIEVSFKSLIADYCSHRSKKQVKRFLQVRIRRGSANPSFKNIIELLGQFDEDWKKTYKANIKSDPDKQHLLNSLQSLVDARNEFAHGGSPTLSIGDVVVHFKNAKKVVEHVDSVVA